METELDRPIPADLLPAGVDSFACSGSGLFLRSAAGNVGIQIARLEERWTVEVRGGERVSTFPWSPARAQRLKTALGLLGDTQSSQRDDGVKTAAVESLLDLVLTTLTGSGPLEAATSEVAAWFWRAVARPEWWRCHGCVLPADVDPDEVSALRAAVGAWLRVPWLDAQELRKIRPRSTMRVHDLRFPCGAEMFVLGGVTQRNWRGADRALVRVLVAEYKQSDPQCGELAVVQVRKKRLAVVPAACLTRIATTNDGDEGG